MVGQDLAHLMAERGWVVGAADVAELMDMLFPREAEQMPGDEPVTQTSTSAGRIATRSMTVPAPGHRPWTWIVMGLILLMAVGAVGFGFGILIDWHGRRQTEASAPAETSMVRDTQAATPDVKDVQAATKPIVDVRDPIDHKKQEKVPDVPAIVPLEIVSLKEIKSDVREEVAQATEIRPEIRDVGSELSASPETKIVKEPPKRKPTVTTLVVQPPDAKIQMRGRETIGRMVVRLKPGERTWIRLEHSDCRSEAFELVWPGPRKLFKNMSVIEKGSLKIRYLPASARLFLDGKRINPSSGLNIVVMEVAAGWHVLSLEDDSGRRTKKRVEVLAGEQTGITLQLE